MRLRATRSEAASHPAGWAWALPRPSTGRPSPPQGAGRAAGSAVRTEPCPPVLAPGGRGSGRPKPNGPMRLRLRQVRALQAANRWRAGPSLRSQTSLPDSATGRRSGQTSARLLQSPPRPSSGGERMEVPRQEAQAAAKTAKTACLLAHTQTAFTEGAQRAALWSSRPLLVRVRALPTPAMPTTTREPRAAASRGTDLRRGRPVLAARFEETAVVR